MPHLGRHPNEYHQFVLNKMVQAAMKSGGSREEFLKLFKQSIIKPVLENPSLLRKSGWK